jgi:AGCS family alanine or glycine:cation symporter
VTLIHDLETFLSATVDIVWGFPTVLLMVIFGIGLSFYLGGKSGLIQFRAFKHAFHVVRGRYDDPNDPGQISHFKALCTALSATIGLGNIGIVAIIIKVGGPGAIFWMILAGFIGMATKFAETTLALTYRKIDNKGRAFGGPMYYIENGLGIKFRPLGKFYALSIAIGSFGISNMFQTNQSAEILFHSFGVPHYVTGLGMAIAAGFVIIGGITRIARVSSLLMPFMATSYVLGCLVVLGFHIEKIPEMFSLIFSSAFKSTAMAGGGVYAIHVAMLQGVKRACFSNEAGLGSAAIAHSAAATNEPVREGTVALLGPFIDTVVICTLTALVILSTGVWETSSAVGVPLTAEAFDTVIYGFGKYFIPVSALLFAFSTLVSWSYYGEVSSFYLGGEKLVLPYKILFCIVAFLGAMWQIKAVLDFSDIMTGLMIFPNLFAIFMLVKKVKSASNSYFTRLDNGEFPVNK